MKKRFLALLTAAMLSTTLLLAACGGDTPAPADSTPPADGGETVAPVDATGGLEIEEGASLVYWSMWGETEPQGMVIAEALEAFTAATGVPIEAQWGARETRKTLEPVLAAGQVIDIFDEDIERVLSLWGDYLLDLTDYVDAEYEGAVYRDQVNSTLINLVQDLGDGRVYEIPYQPSAFVVMYNKDLFEAAGITGVPTTWDEFVEVCEKLAEKDITAITVDDAYMGAFFGYNMTRLAGVEETYAMVENTDFSSPAVLEFAEIWQDMIEKGYMSRNAATNVYPDGQIKEIATGSVAMYLNGTWLPNEIKSTAPDINWGSFAWPSMGNGAGIEANNYGAQSFGIHKDTEYPNAAFALVRWLTTGTWDQRLADESWGVPMANDATWPAQIAEAQTIINNTTVRLDWAARMENDDEIHAAIKDNFSRLVMGDIDAQGFYDAMNSL